MSRSLYIIAYDIGCNKARRKVAQALQNWRMDGQRSLAECWLSPAEFACLWAQLMTHIDEEHDHILVLNQDLRSHDLALGIATIYAGQTLIVG
jgi:CRISPR-associated protein Cas2